MTDEGGKTTATISGGILGLAFGVMLQLHPLAAIGTTAIGALLGRAFGGKVFGPQTTGHGHCAECEASSK